MAKLLLLVVCISVASALPERSGRALSDLRASHHHRSHHDDHHSHHSPDPNKCVDISTYGEVQYKEESFTIHVCENVGHGWNQQNDCERKCETKTEEICLDVETTSCEVEAYADCDEKSEWLNVDETETVEFIPKRCWEDGTQVNQYITVQTETFKT